MKKETRDMMTRKGLVADAKAPAITTRQPGGKKDQDISLIKQTPVQASRARRTTTKRFEIRIANNPDAVRDLKKAARSINRRHGIEDE